MGESFLLGAGEVVSFVGAGLLLEGKIARAVLTHTQTHACISELGPK